MAQIATMTVLYSQEPTADSDSFVELRRWDSSTHAELILEHGALVAGELATEVAVLPFHFTPEEALATLISSNGHM